MSDNLTVKPGACAYVCVSISQSFRETAMLSIGWGDLGEGVSPFVLARNLGIDAGSRQDSLGGASSSPSPCTCPTSGSDYPLDLGCVDVWDSVGQQCGPRALLPVTL